MTNKTKNILVVCSFFLLLLLSYNLAISKTIDLRKEYKSLISKNALFKNAPKELSLLKQKQNYYNSILEKYQLGYGSIQNSLLKTINVIADSSNVKIVAFLEPHTYVLNDLKVNSYRFTLEGNYRALINLIYKLEQETKLGEIDNLHFEKKLDYKTGNYFLTASVILKSFN